MFFNSCDLVIPYTSLAAQSAECVGHVTIIELWLFDRSSKVWNLLKLNNFRSISFEIKIIMFTIPSLIHPYLNTNMFFIQLCNIVKSHRKMQVFGIISFQRQDRSVELKKWLQKPWHHCLSRCGHIDWGIGPPEWRCLLMCLVSNSSWLL